MNDTLYAPGNEKEVFWVSEGVIYIDSLRKDESFTRLYYDELLENRSIKL